MLEIGPGTGYYTLGVARRLGEDGRLVILDVQREMLEHTCRRVRDAGLCNVVPVSADARSLPCDEASFDAAYICVALGEVPDVGAVLRELHRVLRPGGRLVVGESYLDPHVVRVGSLSAAAEAAGLRFERRIGGVAGYFARFEAV